ncbi:MAG: ECF-type sigma factor [Planctomycetota bacterium]
MNAENGERDRDLARRATAGTESVAVQLDHAFRDRLCALVEREMNARYRQREDPEDVVQSALRTYFRRASRGEFQFDHEGALWNLLQKLTRRKILKHVAYHAADKRCLNKEEAHPTQDLPDDDTGGARARVVGDALEVVLAGMAPLEPEIYRLQLFGYSISEIVEIVLEGLDAPYPLILQLRLQGNTESEIAQQLGCGREAIRYKLRRIQQRLSRLLAEPAQADGRR